MDIVFFPLNSVGRDDSDGGDDDHDSFRPRVNNRNTSQRSWGEPQVEQEEPQFLDVRHMNGIRVIVNEPPVHPIAYPARSQIPARTNTRDTSINTSARSSEVNGGKNPFGLTRGPEDNLAAQIQRFRGALADRASQSSSIMFTSHRFPESIHKSPQNTRGSTVESSIHDDSKGLIATPSERRNWEDRNTVASAITPLPNKKNPLDNEHELAIVSAVVHAHEWHLRCEMLRHHLLVCLTYIEASDSLAHDRRKKANSSEAQLRSEDLRTSGSDPVRRRLLLASPLSAVDPTRRPNSQGNSVRFSGAALRPEYSQARPISSIRRLVPSHMSHSFTDLELSSPPMYTPVHDTRSIATQDERGSSAMDDGSNVYSAKGLGMELDEITTQGFKNLVVTSVSSGGRAEEGGVAVGDRFLAVDGIAVASFDILSQLLERSYGLPLRCVVLRSNGNGLSSVLEVIV